MPRKGKDLEIIVAALENQLTKFGVEIKSPDYLLGKRSKSKREVDVSIKFHTGSTDVLIILECRDRNATQDVTWIEQLAEKKEDVCANKAIAVSASKFSEGAINTAKSKGIELRNMNQLDLEAIFDWLSLQYIDLIIPKIKFLDVAIGLKSDVSQASDEGYMATITDGDKIFTDKNNKSLSIVDIWNIVVFPQIQSRLVEGSPPIKITGVVSVPVDSPLYIESNKQKRLISRIDFKAETWIQREKRPLSAKRRYSNDDGTLAESVEFELNDGIEKWVLDINHFPKTNQIGLVTRIKQEGL